MTVNNPQNQPADNNETNGPVSVQPDESERLAENNWSEWAIVVLLSILVALSAAQLFGTVLIELNVESKAALPRFIFLPVLLIASYLLVQKWRKLISRSLDRRNAPADKK